MGKKKIQNRMTDKKATPQTSTFPKFNIGILMTQRELLTDP